MKRFFYLAIMSFLLFSFTVLQAGKDDMVSTLQAGNAAGFAKYFDNTIDVKLPGADEMKNVPKAEAAATLKTFFTSHSITSCTITSQRENGGTMYVTGKLNGANNYNVTAMIKGSGEKFSVITLRINN